jgi:hypothetical protein
VTHLFVCHIGASPSHNASLRDPNQTTTIEVQVNLTLSGYRYDHFSTKEFPIEEVELPLHRWYNFNRKLFRTVRWGRGEVAPLTLGGDLVWGGKEGYCDDLGIIVGQHQSTGVHFVET